MGDSLKRWTTCYRWGVNRNLKVWAGAGLPFGVAMAAVLGAVQGPTGVVTGMVAGGVFGAALAAFVAFQEKNLEAKFGDIFEGRPLLHRGLANHRAGNEMRGGFLLLTDEELVFIPHRMNLQTRTLAIPLASIIAANTGKTLGIVPNRLSVTLKTGTKEMFVVWGNQAWQERLMAQTNGTKDSVASTNVRRVRIETPIAPVPTASPRVFEESTSDGADGPNPEKATHHLLE